MRAKLLKRLRKKAKKYVRVFRTDNSIFPYSIFHSKKEICIAQTLDEVKSSLEEERRSYIKRVIKDMRIQKENKQLRKL